VEPPREGDFRQEEVIIVKKKVEEVVAPVVEVVKPVPEVVKEEKEESVAVEAGKVEKVEVAGVDRSKEGAAVDKEDEKVRKKRNREEIGNFYKAYRRVRLCLTRRDDPAAFGVKHDLEAAYHSMIELSQGKDLWFVVSSSSFLWSRSSRGCKSRRVFGCILGIFVSSCSVQVPLSDLEVEFLQYLYSLTRACR
jgi:hypothetical protein